MESKGLSIAALVLGILSIVSVFTGIGALLGVIFGIVGIVLGNKALKIGDDGKAKAGKICSIVGLCASGLVILYTIFVVGLIGAGAGLIAAF